MLQKDMEKFILLQKAHKLTVDIYRITREFPKEEIYGLTSQMRRAAVSIPSNIAEGKARNSSKEYIRFLLIARGSLEELNYQLLLSKDLRYLSENDYKVLTRLTIEVGKLLNGVISSLDRK